MRFLFVLLLAPLSFGASSSFTLEQVLSAPFVSDLCSNGHGVIAWQQNERGVRNIWVAKAPGFEARPITKYAEDDGQELSELSLSRDGSLIVFTRGEGANGHGEFPNPRHEVSGVEQMVMVAPVSGSGVRELGKGHSPALSPDGRTVAFLSGGQVWSAPANGTGKAAQLIHARGTAEAVAWSPDGQSLVFTSSRAQHSFISVFTLGTKTQRFLDPSVDFDANPVWSPDSKQVAFTRVPTTQEAFAFGPKRAADDPWSIRVADAATGKGREVWRAKPGAGSAFREISGPQQIFWAAGNRLVFPWERSGWTHLYSTSVADGGETELTPGRFEVEDVALTADGSAALVASNQDDIDRRHAWRVPVTGGVAQALSTGSNLEWTPVDTGNAVAVVQADAVRPGRVVVMTGGKAKELTPETRDFPATALVEPQPVTFAAADGMQIHGQLFLPRDGQARHPAVIFFHGGSRRQMLLGWHYMFYYHQAYGFNQYLANHGYVVLSVNYRSGIGYGLDFREALHYGATGGSEYQDVVGAGLYMRSRPDVIPEKIGLWGGSYGGYLTAMGLARASDLFAAGVDLHGVHDWNEEIQTFVPAYDPEKRQDLARVAFLSSPMAYVSTWKSPVLLIQGDDDRNVNFNQTLMLAEALRKQGVPFEQLIFPDEVHDFLLQEHWLAAYHAADHFLGKYLRTQ